MVILRDGGICHLCGMPGATTADHMIPRKLGGPDTLDNLRAAHVDCNGRKGARLLVAKARLARPA
jgi:5-methylcytosine-specific restriction endonuclease McrA